MLNHWCSCHRGSLLCPSALSLWKAPFCVDHWGEERTVWSVDQPVWIHLQSNKQRKYCEQRACAHKLILHRHTVLVSHSSSIGAMGPGTSLAKHQMCTQHGTLPTQYQGTWHARWRATWFLGLWLCFSKAQCSEDWPDFLWYLGNIRHLKEDSFNWLRKAIEPNLIKGQTQPLMGCKFSAKQSCCCILYRECKLLKPTLLIQKASRNKQIDLVPPCLPG